MSIEFNTANGISSTGNVATINQLLGDGYYLSNISAAGIDLTTIQSNIIPSANVTYTLGNATNQWQDLWVSNATVYINSVPISVDGNNDLTVDGGVALLASNTAPAAVANIATTANIVAGNILIGLGGNVVYGDGTLQQTAYSNVILASFLPTYTGNLGNVGNIKANGTVSIGGNLTTPGNITPAANVYANNLISNNLVNGTLTTSFQPNITSVGNLTSVTVAGITGLYDLTVAGNAIVGNIQALGNVDIPPGNVTVAYGNAAELFGDAYGDGALYAGVNDGNVPAYPNVVAQFTSEYTDYVAVNFKNLNSGNKATTDWIASADNATDATNYVDLGIASSTFDGTSANNIGNVIQANDGYLYTQASGNSSNPGGNLVIAATTANRTVGFVAGPGDSANIILTVAGPNISVLNTMNIANYSGDGSQLTGINYGNNLTFGNSNVVIATVDSPNITFAINGQPSGIFTAYNLALGYGAGANAQGNTSVALGYNAGNATQGANSVAIGAGASETTQGTYSVAIGYQAGQTTQGANSVAIGFQAGANAQGAGAVAVGQLAGSVNQGTGAVALGAYAGQSNQAANSIAIGVNAGTANLLANTIVINSSGLTVNRGNAGVYILPLRPTQSTASTTYQYLAYDVANSRVTSWNVNNYNTVYAPYVGTVTANMAGAVAQFSAGSFYRLPQANTLQTGTKFNFFVQANAIVTQAVGTSDFVYFGTGSTTVFQTQVGESVEVLSRGAGSTEYDITGGTAGIKYTNTNNGVYAQGGGWVVALPPSTAWGTQLKLTTYPTGGLITAYMGTDGYLYLATGDGSTITITGQLLSLYFGNAPTTDTCNYILTNTFIKINTQHTPGNTGDTLEFTFLDTTNNRMYRITMVKQNGSPANGSLSIERLH